MPFQRHDFSCPQFATEGGALLPEARLVYGTQGKLNAAGDNAVLLPSHYMADLNGYDWLIGPGKALDPDQLFLITSELFGNGRSSSPSNTPEPFHGPRFPITSIRDNVAITHQLLTEQLGIRHLKSVIGFSMGAQQAFQWAVSHPDFMDCIVASAGTAKTYGHGWLRLESQVAALQADAHFKGGDYTEPPRAGIEAFSLVWTAWLFSQEWWRQELWRQDDPAHGSFAETIEHYRKNFIPGADANDLILQIRTWQAHDVGSSPRWAGDTEAALRSIQARVLYLPAETDLYFPLGEARHEAAFIPQCTLLPIPSLWGHTAGAASNPADGAWLNAQIGAFLNHTLKAC
jgi:homoserine O-acetyltransferase